MITLRRSTSWTVFLGLWMATIGYSARGQEGMLAQRKVPDRKDLTARFTKALANISNANWVTHLPEKSTEAEVGRFATFVGQVREDVHTILNSEVELSPIFLVSMDVSCDAFSDLATSRDREQRMTERLVRRVVGAGADIHIKADYLRAEKRSDVKVKVRTLSPGSTTEDPGCYVIYAPAYDDRPSTRIRFGPISSPTIDTMPPGTFTIWSVRQGKEGRRERITLLAGATEKEFDLESPEK